ncbi:uncharacterized protein LOC124638969 [Helicoverpa zea]|uniref:uncharacterized protein LOC124638969 n=1 Tax=Helicoverpa zea TaxID=7113 RepID=UPI001F57C8C4|nr:uncharacterized protein LOC124638969 [Helicoverpa zea]
MNKRNERKRKIDSQTSKEAQRLYKRRRYAEIKADPELYERQKEKERAKYIKKKEKKQVVGINEKSPREIRQQRKKWREASKKYRLKKKQEIKLQTIPQAIFVEAQDDINADNEEHIQKPDPLHRPESKSILLRKIRYIEQKKRKILQNYIIHLKKKNDALRKKNTALEKKIELLTNKKNIKQKIPTKTDKLKDVLIQQRQKEDRRTNTALVRLVKNFYNDDSNSTLGAGKKEYITRQKIQKQKRYLNYPLKMLYRKFLDTHTVKVSYGFFCKYRPFWVLLPKQKARDTCMCIIHCNIDLLLNCLYKASIIQPKNYQELLSQVCCNVRKEECLSRKCHVCKNKAVIACNEFSNDQLLIYNQWVRCKNTVRPKKGTAKVNMITTKKQFLGSPLEVLDTLNEQLPKFFEHCYKIQTQYINMKNLKETLTVSEAIIHIDFSENYSLKFGTEVQSFHFGGSRKEVTLHTAVVYTFDFQHSAIGTTCVCTVSPCVRHDPSAVWAHLIPLIDVVIKANPFIETLHFQSDSPTSQYRNKYIFFMITQLWKDFPNIKKVTWNYTEAGHGKGAPDGVGAVLKRTADSLVNCGHDIGTFEQFLRCIQENIQNIEILQVTEENIKDRERHLKTNLKPFSGTLSVHQVMWERYSNYLTFRKTSCFACEVGSVCEHGKHLGFHKIPLPDDLKESQHQLDDGGVVTLASTRPPKRILSNITNTPIPSTSRIVTLKGKQAANIVFLKKA